MSRQLDRQPGETVPEFAGRMSDLVRLIQGIVSSHAGMLYDFEDAMSDLDFIIEHARDPGWEECWKLKVDIERIISRTTDVNRLRRILYFAQGMSQSHKRVAGNSLATRGRVK